ncbi:DNA uptake protein ComE-like DNA-binding protein [Orenia metallireducens]|uniref:DNA uptake protein ComE n=1 Tax=Orenia metallireducens TaxID=1413210 RepID=A0A285IGX9_9FIRM|nr:helix-hairpin-helix domain-containing protein [Orenia metallireducens]PRX17815.1 DNA uptake protein ComE-like DNA-binding protein [Orenia metallireducens]SNY47173.1 DNA uptake protein ComE [Orenia metallireducens]
MISLPTSEAINLLKNSLEELESSKGSIQTGIQKLLRAAEILNDEKIIVWCKAQLGDQRYKRPLDNYINKLQNWIEKKDEESNKEVNEATDQLLEVGFKINFDGFLEEIDAKAAKSGGGYQNIGFIEERYNDLVRNKKGNDGTYYKTNLYKNLSYTKKAAHEKATKLYNNLLFSNTPKTVMDTLKDEIDDKLLDLNPELAEKIMLAFQSVSKDNKESWSQALTTCRRFIENLADVLYPAKDEKVNGRKLGKGQYINRIWAFMDEAIESESNKKLAKSHVDHLGIYLESVHKLTNKGVHSEINRIEAVKVVLHTYLTLADIINYIDKEEVSKKEELTIFTASLDELESLLNISRSLAKRIVRFRIKNEIFKPEDLQKIKGIGPKTIEKVKKNFSFN